MNDLELTLVVTRGGKPVVEAALGHQMAEIVASMVADHPSQAALLDALAEHPAASVRRRIASHDCLSRERVAELAADPDSEVRRALVMSCACRRWITGEQLLGMAAADAALAADIAGEIHEFDEVDQDALGDALASHADPGVRAALAGGRSVSRRILKRLSADADPEVALAARDALTKR